MVMPMEFLEETMLLLDPITESMETTTESMDQAIQLSATGMQQMAITTRSGDLYKPIYFIRLYNKPYKWLVQQKIYV